ncbi:MAG TPA: UbiA family prenyltransferase [Polyangiaceae bacterium]|nr:UbiA family prenyltransferase [Polyangiaceae bacterium]
MTVGVWLRLGRVSNLPTVWSNTLAGSVLAGSALTLPAGFSVGLCLALSSFYVGGMYLNDAFDREIDRKERPERPIPSGMVRASSVFTIGFALLLTGMGCSFWAARSVDPEYGPRTLVAGLGLAGLIVLYNLHHKRNPLSPFLMGMCRVLVYVTAACAAAGAPNRAVWLGAAALLSHLIGLTYAAKQENLRVIQNLWPLGFLLLPVGYGIYLGLDDPMVLACASLCLLWLVYALSFLVRREGRSIPGGVVRLIAGISLLDATLLAAAGALELALVAIALAGLTRLAQRYIPGT